MDRKDRIRERVSNSYKSLESKLKVDNPDGKLVYPNQEEAAWQIVELFYEGVMAVTLLALPQVGKTGVMLYVSYLMTTTNNDDLLIKPENVYIISGMNDLDWQRQTKESFPDALNEKIFTRSEFNKIRTLDSLENALIIIDECHIAAEARQQMSSALRRAGLDNPENLKDKNVRILQVSATPAHTLFNAEKHWGDDHAVVHLESGPKYIGFEKLIAADRIMNTHESGVDNILEIEEEIKREYKTPKYHIFRVGRKDRIPFEEMIARNRKNSWISKSHNCETREDTDILFDTPPIQHTFILIKGFWRAGKRLNDRHIGIMYEGPSNIPDLNVVAQSLAGRACGNDKQTPGPGTPIIYCHRQSLEDYITWYNGGGHFNTAYQSRHLKSDGLGNILVRSSFHGEAFRNRVAKYDIAEPTFDTVADARAWVSANLTYGSSEYKLHDADGNEGGTTHIRYRRENRRIMDEATARASVISYGAQEAARIMPVDIGQGANTSARIMPVQVEQGSTDMGWGVASSARIMPVTTPTIKYIVIYKIDFLKIQ